VLNRSFLVAISDYLSSFLLPGIPPEDCVLQGQRHPGLEGHIHGVSFGELPGSTNFEGQYGTSC